MHAADTRCHVPSPAFHPLVLHLAAETRVATTPRALALLPGYCITHDAARLQYTIPTPIFDQVDSIVAATASFRTSATHAIGSADIPADARCSLGIRLCGRVSRDRSADQRVWDATPNIDICLGRKVQRSILAFTRAIANEGLSWRLLWYKKVDHQDADLKILSFSDSLPCHVLLSTGR